jgi:hypothetical protein
VRAPSPAWRSWNLNHCWPGPGALAPVLEALAEGWCPHLRAVDLTTAEVTEAEMLPLLRAVGEGRFPEVRSLSFNDNQIGGAGMQALVEAMGRGQGIEELSIYGSSLTEQDFLLLVGRMRSAPPAIWGASCTDQTSGSVHVTSG